SRRATGSSWRWESYRTSRRDSRSRPSRSGRRITSRDRRYTGATQRRYSAASSRNNGRRTPCVIRRPKFLPAVIDRSARWRTAFDQLPLNSTRAASMAAGIVSYSTMISNGGTTMRSVQSHPPSSLATRGDVPSDTGPRPPASFPPRPFPTPTPPTARRGPGRGPRPLRSCVRHLPRNAHCDHQPAEREHDVVGHRIEETEGVRVQRGPETDERDETTGDQRSERSLHLRLIDHRRNHDFEQRNGRSKCTEQKRGEEEQADHSPDTPHLRKPAGERDEE